MVDSCFSLTLLMMYIPSRCLYVPPPQLPQIWVPQMLMINIVWGREIFPFYRWDKPKHRETKHLAKVTQKSVAEMGVETSVLGYKSIGLATNTPTPALGRGEGSRLLCLFVLSPGQKEKGRTSIRMLQFWRSGKQETQVKKTGATPDQIPEWLGTSRAHSPN